MKLILMEKKMSSSETYTVYSKRNCSFCVRAIDLIEHQGFQVQVKKIDEDSESFQEMRNLAPNMRTVPVIIKDNELIGGYSDLVEHFS